MPNYLWHLSPWGLRASPHGLLCLLETKWPNRSSPSRIRSWDHTSHFSFPNVIERERRGRKTRLQHLPSLLPEIPQREDLKIKSAKVLHPLLTASILSLNYPHVGTTVLRILPQVHSLNTFAWKKNLLKRLQKQETRHQLFSMIFLPQPSPTHEYQWIISLPSHGR